MRHPPTVRTGMSDNFLKTKPESFRKLVGRDGQIGTSSSDEFAGFKLFDVVAAFQEERSALLIEFVAVGGEEGCRTAFD